MQVRRAIAAHVRSLPEPAGGQLRRQEHSDRSRPSRQAGASPFSLNSRLLLNQAPARGRLPGQRRQPSTGVFLRIIGGSPVPGGLVWRDCARRGWWPG
jgi:hypothetical protein